MTTINSTLATFEGLLSNMSAHMDFQMATSSKAQTARITFEGVLSRMSAQMCFQSATLSKAQTERVTF